MKQTEKVFTHQILVIYTFQIETTFNYICNTTLQNHQKTRIELRLFTTNRPSNFSSSAPTIPHFANMPAQRPGRLAEQLDDVGCRKIKILLNLKWWILFNEKNGGFVEHNLLSSMDFSDEDLTCGAPEASRMWPSEVCPRIAVAGVTWKSKPICLPKPMEFSASRPALLKHHETYRKTCSGATDEMKQSALASGLKVGFSLFHRFQRKTTHWGAQRCNLPIEAASVHLHLPSRFLALFLVIVNLKWWF